MSRPTKAVVDYFPHNCRSGLEIFVLESQWGNNGYAVFYKLKEVLGFTEGHFYDCKKESAWDWLIAFLKIDVSTAHEIIAKLCSLGELDKELWFQDLILWSDKFIEELEEVYKRRKVGKPVKPVLCKQEPNLCIQKPQPQEQTADRNPQSKVKGSEVNKAQTHPFESQKEPPLKNQKSAIKKPSEDDLSKAEIMESSPLKIQKDILSIANALAQEKFPKVYEFIQIQRNNCQNDRTILWALRQCSNCIPKNGDFNPWGYCLQIMKIENGNFNAQDFIDGRR